MITLFDFQLLPQPDQVHLITRKGVYIGKRKTETQTVVLYQIEGFYVEIWYFEYRKWIEKIYCFRSTALLDPYLDLIDLEHLA